MLSFTLMSDLLIRQLRKAIKDYDMIKPDDSICVGVSGGKDSLALLSGLAKIRKHINIPFDIKAVTIKLGKLNPDTTTIKEYCKSLEIDYTIVESDIQNVVFELREEKSPCSLCANLRRGMLNSAAKSLGCNKIALGHNKDDAIETFLMSMFYEGRLHVFSPVTYLSRIDMNVIRPLIYSWESDIVKYNENNNISPVKNTCQIAGHTNRERIKRLIQSECEINPDFKYNMFRVLSKNGISGWKEMDA